jgi:oligosaccharide repeat unit polymerase
MLYRRVFGEADFSQIFGYLSKIKASEFLQLVDSYYVYEAYIKILKHFPSQEDFLYGYSYIKPFVFWIPRSIWEDKPEGLSSLVVEKIYGTSKGLEYSTGFTLTGEFYANFGFVGMILCSMLLGLFMGFVSRKMISTKNEYTFIISLTTIIYFPHMARGGILETTILFLFIFYIIFITFYKTKYLYKKIKLF